MPNDVIELSPDQILSLTRGEPIDFQFGEQRLSLVPPTKPKGKAFQGLDDLSADIMAPLKITLEVKPGLHAEFTIRALESDESKECDDIGRDVKPPMREKAGARGVITKEPDFEDTKFIADRQKVNQLRTVFVLSKGMVNFHLPGETLDEKSAALRRKLPPRVVNALYAAITGLTSDPIEVADFS